MKTYSTEQDAKSPFVGIGISVTRTYCGEPTTSGPGLMPVGSRCEEYCATFRLDVLLVLVRQPEYCTHVHTHARASGDHPVGPGLLGDYSLSGVVLLRIVQRKDYRR